jgi:hypothetical protein
MLIVYPTGSAQIELRGASKLMTKSLSNLCVCALLFPSPAFAQVGEFFNSIGEGFKTIGKVVEGAGNTGDEEGLNETTNNENSFETGGAQQINTANKPISTRNTNGNDTAVSIQDPKEVAIQVGIENPKTLYYKIFEGGTWGTRRGCLKGNGAKFKMDKGVFFDHLNYSFFVDNKEHAGEWMIDRVFTKKEGGTDIKITRYSIIEDGVGSKGMCHRESELLLTFLSSDAYVMTWARERECGKKQWTQLVTDSNWVVPPGKPVKIRYRCESLLPRLEKELEASEPILAKLERAELDRERAERDEKARKEQGIAERRPLEEAKRLEKLEEGKKLYCSIQDRYWSTFATKVSDLRSGKRKPTNCDEYAVKSKMKYTTEGFAVKIEPDKKIRFIEGKLVNYRGTKGTVQSLPGIFDFGTKNDGADFVTDKKTHWINKDSIQIGRSEVSVIGQYIGNTDFTWTDGRVTSGIVLRAECISRRPNRPLTFVYIAPTSSEMLSLLTAEEATFYDSDLYKKTRWKDLVGEDFEGCANGDKIKQNMIKSNQ